MTTEKWRTCSNLIDGHEDSSCLPPCKRTTFKTLFMEKVEPQHGKPYISITVLEKYIYQEKDKIFLTSFLIKCPCHEACSGENKLQHADVICRSQHGLLAWCWRSADPQVHHRFCQRQALATVTNVILYALMNNTNDISQQI